MIDVSGNVAFFKRFRRAVTRTFRPAAVREEPEYSDEEAASDFMDSGAKLNRMDERKPKNTINVNMGLIRTPLHPDHWMSLPNYSGRNNNKVKPCPKEDALPQQKGTEDYTSNFLQSVGKLDHKQVYNFSSRSASGRVASRAPKPASLLHNGMNGKQDSYGFEFNGHHRSRLQPVSSSDVSSSESSQSTSQHYSRKRMYGATLNQCIRLQEREQYQMMLQSYTFEPLLMSRVPNSDHPKKGPPMLNVETPLKPNDGVQTNDMPSFFAEKLNRQQTHNLSRRIRSTAFSTPFQSFREIADNKFTETSGIASNGIGSSKSRKECGLKNGDRQRTVASRISTPFQSSRSTSFSNHHRDSAFFTETWLHELKQSLQNQYDVTKKAIQQGEEKVQTFQQQREAEHASLQAKIKENLKLKSFEISDDLLDIGKEEDLDVSADFPELTPEMEEAIDEALHPVPPDEVITEGFHLSIRRRDMETLAGLNWLNDEIINFYMNLLMERGKLDNYPSVYAFNTFFYPRLMSGGHQALKRWTRKIDIFSYDFIVIPVHLGMHWCLAVVNFKEKKLQYYDSMGGKNMECLQALRNYLQDESLDKKKEEMDTTDWVLEMVKDIPHQMNGSDCGMFACKYAEYVTRRAKINFTQADMPYFRRRMVYEILTQQLL